MSGAPCHTADQIGEVLYLFISLLNDASISIHSSVTLSELPPPPRLLLFSHIPEGLQVSNQVKRRLTFNAIPTGPDTAKPSTDTLLTPTPIAKSSVPWIRRARKACSFRRTDPCERAIPPTYHSNGCSTAQTSSPNKQIISG
ncbi:unnamed protein product [Echinostoma caproni]|uniref:Uncharacterized protein n=1 Tax=Echinostoma caproni TaxID=27848 RepID=A0A183B5G0_9TREM|nr:unnamed protein product [Echinostoma caproni]